MRSLSAYEWLDGRYRLKEKIGEGTFGEVWLVYDSQRKKDVAAKICFGATKDESDFEKEYRTTKELDHPNLIHPLDFGVVGERAFIIMPYCPSSASRMVGCCNDMMAWKFLRDVSHGLAYLHREGVVHHDIKPDNILIDESGQFKITDFGVSTQFGDYYHPGDEELKGGTVGYMGPEMFRSDAKSIKATDIWALGATTYEMLAGELPFYALGGRSQNNGAVLNEIHHVSSNLMQLVRDCMAKETWDRPTASEIAEYTRILFDESRDHPYWDEYFRSVRKKAPTPVWNPEPQPVFEPGHSPYSEPVKKRKLWRIVAIAAAVVGIVIASRFMINTNDHQSPSTDNYDNMDNNNVLVETYKQPAPAEATYLKVNGSNVPQQLKVGSSESSKTIEVETDGPNFSVEIPEKCVWITQAAKTSNSFVLYFTDNATENIRKSTIKVISGTITTELPVSQEPVKAKVLNPNLTPVQTNHNQKPSSGNKPNKKDDSRQQSSNDDEPEKQHNPINLPVRRLNPVLY